MEDNLYGLDAIPEHEASKVHFSTDVSLNTEIAVRPKDNGSVDVHLGFLSIDHTYEVEFNVPNTVGQNFGIPTMQSPDTQVLAVDLSEDNQALKIKLEMKCREEGKMKRTLHLESEDSKKMIVNVFAKVMAKHRGTPMLKNNVRCIHVEDDTMSDASDWQGF